MHHAPMHFLIGFDDTYLSSMAKQVALVRETSPCGRREPICSINFGGIQGVQGARV